MAGETCGKVMYVEEVPSTRERYLSVDCQWTGQYMSKELVADWDCFSARLKM